MIIEGLSKQAPPIIRDVDAIEMGRNKIQKRVSNKWTPSRPHKLFQFPLCGPSGNLCRANKSCGIGFTIRCSCLHQERDDAALAT